MEDPPVLRGEERGREVCPENGIIQGDASSQLQLILSIALFMSSVKKSVGDRVEVLNYMDDLKASMSCVETAQNIHQNVKQHTVAV